MIKRGDFAVEVIRSRRRTLTLMVREGAVCVRVPLRLPHAEIEAVITRKRNWIERKLAEHRLAPAPPERSFISGEEIPYLGRNYRLEVALSDVASVRLMQESLRVRAAADSLHREAVRAQLTDWYARQAEQHLIRRCRDIGKLVGRTPKSVTVKHYRARWGSCSVSGDIRFNWEIIMAPPAVVDYLVAHELCHLLEHNHSAAFWRLVEQACPDYRRYRAWLKSHGRMLRL
ncbi:MAG: M48 family metallopeptidase [Gammaproteobacteria bacterium]|nr:M48 family metallopeptidase [Gammaproteobacteria bacterium]